ncbi:phage protein [Bacillus cereus B5-2]|nr:phage protein [Bacillus cereus B5-2]
MKQLTLEDVVGTFDYKAKSTAEQFLATPSVIASYEVHFYDREERQKLDCFDANTESEAWDEAIKEHGKGIQKIGIKRSNRTRAEFLALD